MSSLVYPKNLTPDSDYVTFEHFEYRPNNEVLAKGFKGGANPPASGSAIKLYMPENTPGTQNNNEWGAVDFTGPLGLARQAVAAAAVDAATMNGSRAAQSIRDAMGSGQLAKLGKQAAQQAIVGAVAGMAGMSASQAFAMRQGEVFNPNVELLYNSPSLRAVNFNFKLVASSPEESRIIRDIIREFKMWSAPKDEGQMFKVPHVWQISYNHPEFMGKFKKCALTTVAVQANPSTQFHATYGDGAPIEYSLGLGFMETDIITREDHTSGIGF